MLSEKKSNIKGFFVFFILTFLVIFPSVLAYSDRILNLGEPLIDEGTVKVKESIQTCNDSDNKNFFEKGNITLTKGNKSKVFEDNCLDDSILVEYICLNEKKDEIEEECEYGCFEGRCLNCEETDSCGLGEITGEIILETECVDGTFLGECNIDGFRCVDLELVVDKSCLITEDVEVTFLEEYIGKIEYIYVGNEIAAKKTNTRLQK